MKKPLALLLSFAMVVLLVAPVCISSFTALATFENAYSDVIKIYNTTGTVSSSAEVLSCKLNGGKIAVKVKLGANDYVQFVNPVTDLIDNPGALQINLENHEFGTVPGADNTTLQSVYYNCDFRVALTENANYTNAGYNARWIFSGPGVGYSNVGGSNPYIICSANSMNAYRFIAQRNSVLSRGVALSLHFIKDTANGNKIRLDTTDGDNNTGADAENLSSYVPDAQTPTYVRLISNKEQVYNICLKSSDIAAPYSDVVKVYNTTGTVSDESEILSCQKIDGRITVKAKLGANDYIQFADPVTDLIDNPGALQISLENHEFGTVPGADNTALQDVYYNCDFRVALTENSDYTNTGYNARWVFSGPGAGYPNIGGTNPYILSFVNGYSAYRFIAQRNSVLSRDVALSLHFIKDTANGNKIRLDTTDGDNNTGEDNENLSAYAPDAQTPTYVRLISNKEQIYNIRLNSDDIVTSYSDIVKIYNNNGTISNSAQVFDCERKDGKITLKAKLGADDYIQFTDLVTDLIDNPGALQISLENHEFGTVPGADNTALQDAYYNCNFRVGLTENADYTNATLNANWVLAGPGAGYAGNNFGSDSAILSSAGSISGWYYIAKRSSILSRDVALSLTFAKDAESGKILLDTPNTDKKTDYNLSNYAPAAGTRMYVRLTSQKEQVYNICLKSADITTYGYINRVYDKNNASVNYEDIIKIYNADDVVTDKAEVLKCEKKDGYINLKVRLGVGDYIQFVDPVTDLIDNPDALQINLEDHEFGTVPGKDNTALKNAYRNCYFKVALTENSDYTNTAENAHWFFGGPEVGWNDNFATYSGAILSAAGSISAWRYIALINNVLGRGVALSLQFTEDTANGGKLRLDSTASDTNVAGENMNLSDYVPNTNAYTYVRLESNKEQVYNIRLRSADIVTPYSDIVRIHNTTGTVSNTAEVLRCIYEDGKITVKVKLGKDDYIQFADPVTDLIDNPGALQISLEDHEFGTVPGTANESLANAYYNCDFRVALTEDAEYTNTGYDARWIFSGPGVGYSNVGGTNPYIISSANNMNAYRFIAQRNSVLDRGAALSLYFIKDTANGSKIRLDTTDGDNNTGADAENLSAYAPDAQTPTYVRLISNKEQIYNIRLNSEDISMLSKIPAFVGASVTIENNLKLNFYVPKELVNCLDRGSDKVIFTTQYDSLDVTEKTEYGDYYKYSYSDIGPDRIGTVVNAQLVGTYNHGVEFASKTLSYSVKTYCESELKETNNWYLHRLLVDLLNYGAASQIFVDFDTDNLVNNSLTAAQKASVLNRGLTSVKAISASGGTNEVPFKSVSLNLKDAVSIKFVITAESTEGLSVVVKNADGSTTYANITDFVENKGTPNTYIAKFDGLMATQMSETVKATVYKAGKPVSKTLTYSIESYAASKKDSSDAKLARLVKSMMKYGDSAAAMAKVYAGQSLTLRVAEFGTKGDGVTDDAPAISEAINALRSSPAGSVLEFENGKTYYYEDNGTDLKYLFYFYGDSDLTVKGNNCLVKIGGRQTTYANIEKSNNIKITGFNLDYAVKPAFKAEQVVSMNTSTGVAVIIADRPVDMENGEIYTPLRRSLFASTPTAFTRPYFYINKYEMIDKSARKIRVYFDTTRGSTTYFSWINKYGVVLPMPYYGFADGDETGASDSSFALYKDTNLTFEDVNVYSNKYHAFVMRECDGTVTFDNVQFVRAPYDQGLIFSSWGDIYHTIHCRAKLTWKNCKNEHPYDDVFNIQDATLYVSEKHADNEVSLTAKDSWYGVPRVKVGDEITIINTSTGAMIGRPKVTEVVSNSKTVVRVVLDQSLSSLGAGENFIAWDEDTVCDPASEMINCTMDGTFRARTNMTFTNCSFHVRRFWIGLEVEQEGPLPRNILFNGCTFDNAGENSVNWHIRSYNTSNKSGYHVENVVFNNCTGITMSRIQKDPYDQVTIK